MRVSFSLILFACTIICSAQEVITPPAILPGSDQPNSALFKKASDTLDFPFFDDFSTSSRYPDDEKWIDNRAYINNVMVDAPISFNVATLDGLGFDGLPYEPGERNSKGSIADALTSLPIDLSNYSLRDSIYFTFFYLGKGNGDTPEPYDSLVLQFKPIAVFDGSDWDSSAWKSIWNTSYDSVEEFQQVHIPFDFPDGSNMYHDAFQFRFVNYGNRSGALDHWHVDYIYLDQNRSQNDINFEDICLIRPMTSILSRYRSMPFNQFLRRPNEEIRDQIDLSARNLFSNLQQTNIGFEIRDKHDNQNLGSDFFTINVGQNYDTVVTRQNSQFNYQEIQRKDRIEIELRSAVFLSQDNRKFNDTFSTTQVFHNYFAYDDGSAEGGYGVTGGDGKVAVQFETNEAASLRGIAFYFNRSRFDVADDSFDIVIWNRLSPIGTDDDEDVEFTRIRGLKPDYTWLNTLVYFELPEPVAINGNFYVGWEQYDDFILNVGLDNNYRELIGDNLNDKLFYNVEGSWQKTTVVNGALMIRPFFGDSELDTVILKDELLPLKREVKVYPNPSPSKSINISSTFQFQRYQLIDLNGRLVKSGEVKGNKIDFPNVSTGMYLLQLQNAKNTEVKKVFLGQP